MSIDELTFTPGSLVRVRGRTCVVQPESEADLLIVRPLGGKEEETQAVYKPLGFDAGPRANGVPPAELRRPGEPRAGPHTLRRSQALAARDLRSFSMLRQARLPTPGLPARAPGHGAQAGPGGSPHDRRRRGHRKDRRSPPHREGDARAGRDPPLRRDMPSPSLRSVGRGARGEVRHRGCRHPIEHCRRSRPARARQPQHLAVLSLAGHLRRLRQGRVALADLRGPGSGAHRRGRGAYLRPSRGSPTVAAAAPCPHRGPGQGQEAAHALPHRHTALGQGRGVPVPPRPSRSRVRGMGSRRDLRRGAEETRRIVHPAQAQQHRKLDARRDAIPQAAADSRGTLCALS